MNLAKYQFLAVTLLMAIFAGCTQHESPQEIKEKTAKATAEMKRDAKAVADGVRQGWNDKDNKSQKPSPKQTDHDRDDR